VSNSDFTETNYGLTANNENEEDVHGISRGLISDTAPEYVWKDRGKPRRTSVRIIVQTEIRTRHESVYKSKALPH
jgi:hypothetical protein